MTIRRSGAYRAASDAAKSEPDVRGFDRALDGVNAALKAVGRGYAGRMETANRWHNPLASENGEAPFEEVVKRMEWVLAEIPRDLDSRYEFDPRAHEPYGSVYEALGQMEYYSHPEGEGFDKEVDALIDRNIKERFPKTRRNTKRYGELHDQVLQKAQSLMRDDFRKKAERHAKAVGERAQEGLRKAEEALRKLGEDPRILDLLALKPDSEVAKKAEAAIVAKRAMLERSRETWLSLQERTSGPAEPAAEIPHENGPDSPLAPRFFVFGGDPLG